VNLIVCCNLDHQYTSSFPQAASGNHGHKQEIQDDDYESIGLCLHYVDM